mgnify:CR=1 FL=1
MVQPFRLHPSALFALVFLDLTATVQMISASQRQSRSRAMISGGIFSFVPIFPIFLPFNSLTVFPLSPSFPLQFYHLKPSP